MPAAAATVEEGSARRGAWSGSKSSSEGGCAFVPYDEWHAPVDHLNINIHTQAPWTIS